MIIFIVSTRPKALPMFTRLRTVCHLGLSQLCSVFDQLCYSIMLHYLINYASKCTNYASYMTNYSQIKIVNFIRFSLKMQCKKGGKSYKESVVVS